MRGLSPWFPPQNVGPACRHNAAVNVVVVVFPLVPVMAMSVAC